jgi:hypothetical protein
MLHIYNCEILNKGKQPDLKYDEIFNGNIKYQIITFKHFEININTRENLKKKSKDELKPPFDFCDPLSCTVDSNGYIYIYIYMLGLIFNAISSIQELVM